MSRAVTSLLVALVLAFGPLLRVLCDGQCITSVAAVAVMVPSTLQPPCHHADPADSHQEHRPFAPQSSDCRHGQTLVRGMDSAFKLATSSTDVSSVARVVGFASDVVVDVTASRRLTSLGGRFGVASLVVSAPLRI